MYIDFKQRSEPKKDPLNSIGYIFGRGERPKDNNNHSKDAKSLVICIIQEVINGGIDNSSFLTVISDGIRSNWNNDVSKVDAILLLRAIDETLHNDDYLIESDDLLKELFLNASKKGSVVSFEEEATSILDFLRSFYENVESLRRYGRCSVEINESDSKSETASQEGSNIDDNTKSTRDLLIRKKMQKQLQENWLGAQNEISLSLKNIQPDIASLLETVMNFTKSIDEKFVLRLVDLLVELYNLLYDGYVAHRNYAYDSNNKNYQNAVENYLAYMDSIADIMSSFGVEEIYSNPGEEYNPHIHEHHVVQNNAKKSAIIKEHLKSGFIYKDNIIQKELVVLE